MQLLGCYQGKEMQFTILLGSMLCNVRLKAGFCWMRFQCVVYLCLLPWTSSDYLIAKSVLLEIGISCLRIQIQTVGEDVMFRLGHLRKAASANHGATAPAFNSQDAEGLISHILTFTLA